jgi:hypothetical protein
MATADVAGMANVNATSASFLIIVFPGERLAIDVVNRAKKKKAPISQRSRPGRFFLEHYFAA